MSTINHMKLIGVSIHYQPQKRVWFQSPSFPTWNCSKIWATTWFFLQNCHGWHGDKAASPGGYFGDCSCPLNHIMDANIGAPCLIAMPFMPLPTPSCEMTLAVPMVPHCQGSLMMAYATPKSRGPSLEGGSFLRVRSRIRSGSHFHIFRPVKDRPCMEGEEP